MRRPLPLTKTNLCGRMADYHKSPNEQFEWKVNDPLNANLTQIRVQRYFGSMYGLELVFSNGEKYKIESNFPNKKWYTLDPSKGQLAKIHAATEE